MNLSGLNFSVAAQTITSGTGYQEIFIGQVPRGVEFDVLRVLLINSVITQQPWAVMTFDRVRQFNIQSAVSEIGADFPQWEAGSYVALPGTKIYLELRQLGTAYIIRGDVSGRMVTQGHFWAARDEPVQP